MIERETGIIILWGITYICWIFETYTLRRKLNSQKEQMENENGI